jgi:hypothetical protein
MITNNEASNVLLASELGLSYGIHSYSPALHPARKNEQFQAEWEITANQPLPLIHTRKLKKNEGNTKSQFA